MRAPIVCLFCFLVFGAGLLISARSERQNATVTIRLVNSITGKPMSGIVRINKTGKTEWLKLAGLFDRLKGLEKSAPEKGWYVVRATGGRTTLAPGQYRIEALSGLETAVTRFTANIRGDRNIELKLRPLFNLRKQDLAAGNTHLHLRNMSLQQADEYIRQIPPADGLDVLFTSYLERHKDDLSYITNKYPVGDLKQFDVTGVLVNNGEEHRHNFKGFGQGYGHVMLLDIKKLVQPVSIGPGIMAKGFDDTPLRPGIDNARKQGGTIIWCHNTFGYEDVLNALSGRLDAMNVFDGSRRDTYEDSYYHYLNVGRRIPISTGTDWFMYDFSRVYAKVAGKLSIKSWLDAVKKGRCQATNGPLLALTVEGRDIGDVIDLKEGKVLSVRASGIGRHRFRLQLIHNGKIIKTANGNVKMKDRCQAKLKQKVRVERPGWFAARIDGAAKNELGKKLYAHTSPIYVRIGGKDRFDVDSARELIRQLEEGKAAIRAQGRFSNSPALARVLRMYDEGIAELAKRLNK